jgi:hypothetical protein
VHLILLLFIFLPYKTHLTLRIAPEYMHRDIEFRVAIEVIPINNSQSVSLVANSTKQVIKSAMVNKVIPPKAPTKSTPKKDVAIPKNQNNRQQQVSQKKVVSPQPSSKEIEHMNMYMSSKTKSIEQEYESLYHEIAQVWLPPPGVPADCSCVITVAIDWQGMVAQMNINASSGMLVYDLAAQAALSELQFPKIAWGKSITITFTV